MCGIAGVKRFGDAPITEDQIKVLLCSLQHRGTDASGIALMKGTEIKVHKADWQAWTYITTKGFTEFLAENLSEETDTVLLHTRAATCGNPRENKNNHPLTLGGAAIVHNGMIHNHTEIFKQLKVERSAETDSDVIRALVDVHGISKDAVRELGKLDGSCAAACIHPDFPGKLLLLRSGSPLVMAKVGDHFMWASEKGAINRASRPWSQWNNFWVQEEIAPIRWCATPVDTAMIVGPNGLEFHGEFKTCRYYTTPDYTRQRKDYHARQARWDKDLGADTAVCYKEVKEKDGFVVKYYRCRNPKCPANMYIPKELKDTPLTEISCTKCGWYLEQRAQDTAVTFGVN